MHAQKITSWQQGLATSQELSPFKEDTLREGEWVSHEYTIYELIGLNSLNLPPPTFTELPTLLGHYLRVRWGRGVQVRGSVCMAGGTYGQRL